MGGKSQEVQETPEETMLAQIANERWQDYKQRFIPVENAAMDRVEQMNKSHALIGQANANTQMQFSQGQRGLTNGMTNRGMRAGSGGFGINLGSYNIDRAASSGLGQANAYGLRTSQYLHNLESEIAMGQGKATSAMSGMSDVASLAQRRAIIDAQAAIAARGAIGEGLGTFAGMAYQGMISPKTTVNVGLSPQALQTNEDLAGMGINNNSGQIMSMIP